MSFRTLAQSASLAALAVTSVACSSSSSNPATSTKPDGGTGGAPSAEAGTGTGGGGGKAGGGTGGATPEAGSNEGAVSCGDTPILGDFWDSPPADCAACFDAQCCAERSACTSDAACNASRECLVACDHADTACQAACATNTMSNALGTCRNNCTACLDLTCEGTAWPAPATAHDITMTATYTNFSGGKPVPGLTVKVCAHDDVNCSAPLDQGVTKSDGTISLKLPAAAGGTDAYLEQTGPGILSELSYLHFLGADTIYTGITLNVLDSATGALFQKLAGGVPFPDAGLPDASADSGVVTAGALSVLPRSCKNTVVAGATISSSNAGPAAVTSYLVKGIPSKTATATDSTGIAAIVGHATGQTTVTVKVGTKTLGTATVIVRPGILTTVTVPPS